MEEGQAEGGGVIDANGTEKRHKKKKDKKKKKSKKKKDGEAENGMDGVVLDDAAAAAGDDVENDPVRRTSVVRKACRGRLLSESGVAQGYQAFLREVAVEEAKAAREEAGGQRKGKKK